MSTNERFVKPLHDFKMVHQVAKNKQKIQHLRNNFGSLKNRKYEIGKNPDPDPH